MPPSSFESADDSGRISDGDDICRKITNHNRAGTDHRVLTDRDARTDDHAAAQPVGWAAVAAAGRLNVPLLLTFHALGTVARRYQGRSDTSPLSRIRVETAVAAEADCIVATCGDEVTELGFLGIPAGKVAVVPCGVDLAHFSLARGKTASAAVPDRAYRFRLVSAGRLVRRKGYDTTIQALTQLPETELLIAGGDATPESEHDRLTALAEQLGVAERVRLIGQVARTEMPALLRSADLVVCSPWYEPFGLVPLEAMACGVPVVASAVGGLLDSVVDSVTGAHVPLRDPAALAAAIGALLDAPNHRAELSRAGLERVRSRYSSDRMAADTAAVYQRTVKRQDTEHARTAPYN